MSGMYLAEVGGEVGGSEEGAGVVVLCEAEFREGVALVVPRRACARVRVEHREGRFWALRSPCRVRTVTPWIVSADTERYCPAAAVKLPSVSSLFPFSNLSCESYLVLQS